MINQNINQILTVWKSTILGNVIEINKYSVDKDYPFEEIEYIDIASVEDREVKTKQSLKLADSPSRARRIVKNNNILISTVRPNLKHFCYIKESTPNLVSSTGFAVISAIPEKSDPKFIYYLLTTDEYTEYLTKIADSHTSAYPSFNSDIILNSELTLPPLPEQRAIASVLSAFDDKIELLREQNKTLEAIAQTLFHRWFVEFNFPDENNQPYRDSGGKMVDSELGEVPERWRVGKLGDYIEIRGGTTPSTNNPDFWNGNINWTSPKDLSNSNEVFLLSTEKKITEEGLNQISSGLLPKYTLLLSSRAPIGYLAITAIETAINQGYIAFLPSVHLPNYFMYLWLNRNMNIVEGSANGSTFLEISKSSFREIESIIPTKDILQKFDLIVKPIFAKILFNLCQIQTLSQLRDALLPKLMRGEVRVKS